MASERCLQVELAIVAAAVDPSADRAGYVNARPIGEGRAIGAVNAPISGERQAGGLDHLPGGQIGRAQLVADPENHFVGRLVEAAALCGAEQAE